MAKQNEIDKEFAENTIKLKKSFFNILTFEWLALVVCPKCETGLNTRNQFYVGYHDITCPTCSSRLAVKMSSRIFAAVVGIVLLAVIWVPSFFWLSLSYFTVTYFIVSAIICFVIYVIFLNTVFYSKLMKFKLKINNWRLKTCTIVKLTIKGR